MKRVRTQTHTTPGTNNHVTRWDRGFDVFINFRGPDSRHTVANVLYSSLTRAGFRVFLDDEEIRKGEVIQGELLGAITNSRIYIPIFSRNYASSRWCLRELAEIIHCWETSSGNTKKVILPIFYDVDVSQDVKLRSHMYTTALQRHKDELGQVTVKPWEDALRKVATIKGWNLNDHGLTELADLIKEEVFSKVIPNEVVPRVFNPPVGIDQVTVKPWEDALLKVTMTQGWNLNDHSLTELADLFKKEFFSMVILSDVVPRVFNPLIGIDEPVQSSNLDLISCDLVHTCGSLTELADRIKKEFFSKVILNEVVPRVFNPPLGIDQVTVRPLEDALRKVATAKGWNLNDHCLTELADLIEKEFFSMVIPNEVVPRVFNPPVRIDQVTIKPLKGVATTKEWNLNDHSRTELADIIKKEVFCKVSPNEVNPRVFNPLIGIDEPVKDIMELLEVGNPAVRFIVIHGMGGIGKTTLAEAVFKKISSRFQGSCFLKDVRRSSSDGDIMKLQKKLLIDTLNLRFIEVSTISDGIHMISNRLHDQNVLIVLDDVDKRDHILKLAENSSWFGPKSRIIITTRNIEFLPNKANKEYYFYAMKEMHSYHALQLFCQHAFEKDWPPLEFYDISTHIVATTGRLPLALQVIGSSLYNQEIATWKFRLEKLKEAPHKDVQETLMISYQALEYEQQQIFLDIACFFNNEKMTDPIYFWEACKYYPDSGINILVRRSMIKVHGDDTLWMHDQLRCLGRAISQANLPCLENQWLSKPSRLWYPEVALDVVQKLEVDESVLALNFGSLDDDCCFVREQFARGVKLKFLQLQGGNFEGDFKNIFQQLIWVSWSDCPLRYEVANLCFKNLVILKLSRSQITEDWGGWRAFMEAKNLKIMHLRRCKCLKKTPNFSSFLGLERLILKNCSGLEEIDKSIHKLKHLSYLEISNGTVKTTGNYSPEMPARLQLLPGSIGSLKSLIELKIENAGLTELHPSIGDLVNLKLLRLRCPQLEAIPGSIGRLILLLVLDLSYSRIKELPNSIGNLKQLNILRMEYSAIEYLPDTIGRLESLEELSVHRSVITRLPGAIRNLRRLKVMSVSLSLENLERSKASFCERMEIPEVTCLDPQTLTYLPSSLDSLILYDVKSPIDWQFLSSLSNLSTLTFVNCWLKDIKFDGLEQLRVLHFENCQFPEGLSDLVLKDLQEIWFLKIFKS